MLINRVCCNSNYIPRSLQVRHIHSCISASVDFSTPENLSHTFHLVEQLRKLPQCQVLAEDKLQVKNIIFHSVKTALAVIEDEKKPLEKK